MHEDTIDTQHFAMRTSFCGFIKPNDEMSYWSLLSMMFAKPAMNVITASASKQSDSCGVRTHAFADWRLKPAP